MSPTPILIEMWIREIFGLFLLLCHNLAKLVKFSYLWAKHKKPFKEKSQSNSSIEHAIALSCTLNLYPSNVPALAEGVGNGRNYTVTLVILFLQEDAKSHV